MVTNLLAVIILIFSSCLIIFALIMLFQNFRGIPPFLPSFNKSIKEALTAEFSRVASKNQVSGELDNNENQQEKPKFIDLGSGNGKIVFMAAQLGYDAYGVEINPFLIMWSRLRALLWKNNQPTFILASYHNVNIEEYDVVFTYLFPKTMQELETKIFSELPDHGVVISNTFKFAETEASHPHGEKVHVYFKSIQDRDSS